MAKIKLNLQEYGRLSEPQGQIPKVLKGEKGDPGERGEKGDPGIPGQRGEAGHTPVITASKSGTTTTIYADGVPIAQIEDGEGRMPDITAEKVGTVTTIYVDGDPIAQISDGTDGTDGRDGTDGHTPVITTSRSGKVVTILADGVDVGTVSDGADGKDGQDGHSPQVTASKTGKVTTISVDGTPIATVNDGNDGQTGQKGDSGISPSVSVSTITGGHRVSVIDASGTDTFDVMDGADGQDGNDGHSPQVTASKSGKVTTISVDGTPIATVNDGADGQDGSDGTDGKSAYEYAVDGGYSGTEAEFAQKLAEEYVGFEDYASTTDAGIIKIVSGGGITIDSNHGIKTTPATNNQVKGGTEASRQIVPNNQHSAAFYGLAKAAGDTSQSASSNAVGKYTDDARIAIQKMLGIYEPPWELLNTITLSEIGLIDLTTDSDGVPYNLRNVFIDIMYPADAASISSGYSRFYIYDANDRYLIAETGRYQTSPSKKFKLIRTTRCGNLTNCSYTLQNTIGGQSAWNSKPINNSPAYNALTAQNGSTLINFGNIVRIGENSQDSEPEGTIIKIYGQRAY